MDAFELVKKLFKHFEYQEYVQALEIADQIEQEFPDMHDKTHFWKACIYSVTERMDNAIQSLVNGLEEGVWWNPATLTADPDLKNLQNHKGFQDILTACEERFKRAQNLAKPELLVMEPYDRNCSKPPVLFSIHWRGENAKRFSQYWNIDEIRKNRLLAFPQSSQIYGYNQFCWDNHELAKEEIISGFKRLTENYTFDSRNIILAGASQGGKLALEMVLTQAIPVKGFILVVPSIREKDLEELQRLLQNTNNQQLKGYIITGDQDPFYPAVQKLMAECERQGYNYQLIVKEGMGHFFPEDFSQLLLKLLKEWEIK